MTIKRYRMEAQAEFGQEAWAVEVEKPKGEWVRYTDHIAAIAEKDAEIARLVEALESEHDRAEDQAGLVGCACCYDNPTDLCATHKRLVDAASAAGFAEGIRRALDAIANLETPMTEDCMLGHEDAYRAVKALVAGGQP